MWINVWRLSIQIIIKDNVQIEWRKKDFKTKIYNRREAVVVSKGIINMLNLGSLYSQLLIIIRF